MLLEIKDQFGPVSVEQVEELETQNHLKLPPKYRAFLLRSNGGRPSPSVIDVPKWPGKVTRIGDFFGITSVEGCNLQFWIGELRNRLLPGFIAMADDPGGNLFCLGTGPGYAEKIYYWDASPDWNLSEETGTMFFVANNIDELLEKLHD